MRFLGKECSSDPMLRERKWPISAWKPGRNPKGKMGGRNTDHLILSTGSPLPLIQKQRLKLCVVSSRVKVKRKCDARKRSMKTSISVWCVNAHTHQPLVALGLAVFSVIPLNHILLTLFGLSAFRILFHRTTSTLLHINRNLRWLLDLLFSVLVQWH